MANEKVLIIDDEEKILNLVTSYLEREGYDIFTAQNGLEGLKLSKEVNPDIIVLDIMLPGMDGIETLKQIKQIEPLIEIVMLTGHASIESGMEAMKLGAYDYVMKPCDIDELLIKSGDAYQHKLLKEKEKTG